MSISSALLAGVSGLTANSSALAAISDNIANVNTIGYKRADTQFEDLVTASSGLKGSYTAGGVAAVTRNLLTQQGEFASTASPTDMAINGQGFFVVTTDPTGTSATSPRDFTRAGSFTPDKQGYLQNSAGFYLQGWLVDANGDINTDPSDITKLQTININSQAGAAGATTAVSINANLNADTTVSAAAATYNAATAAGSMAAYSPTSGTGVKPDFTIPMTVTDSQGGSHSVELRLLKSSTPNQWNYELVSSPATDVVEGAGLHDGQLGTGVLAFTPSGQLDPTATTGILNGTSPSLAIGASGTTPAANAVSWATSLGISGQTIALNLGVAPGGMTQYASDSVVQSTTNNGVNYGNLAGISIDEQGFVTATYDNGVTRKIAQVAIATFPNADGLKPISGDAYQVSLASGTYNLKTPGTGGAGKVESSQLENSTVDLSTEFTGLITTQRAYSASSKIITTTDEMLQELIDIKR
jgi:flagellar hook protein FlgE